MTKLNVQFQFECENIGGVVFVNLEDVIEFMKFSERKTDQVMVSQFAALRRQAIEEMKMGCKAVTEAEVASLIAEAKG